MPQRRPASLSQLLAVTFPGVVRPIPAGLPAFIRRWDASAGPLALPQWHRSPPCSGPPSPVLCTGTVEVLLLLCLEFWSPAWSGSRTHSGGAPGQGRRGRPSPRRSSREAGRRPPRSLAPVTCGHVPRGGPRPDCGHGTGHVPQSRVLRAPGTGSDSAILTAVQLESPSLLSSFTVGFVLFQTLNK